MDQVRVDPVRVLAQDERQHQQHRTDDRGDPRRDAEYSTLSDHHRALRQALCYPTRTALTIQAGGDEPAGCRDGRTYPPGRVTADRLERNAYLVTLRGQKWKPDQGPCAGAPS